jgi:hypothetical protein
MFGYLILEGVRRAVATREAGRFDIPAIIEELGQPDVQTRLVLSELFTTKLTIARDFRYIRDVEYPTVNLGTEPPPISVVAIASAQQLQHLTPIADVVLT